MCFKGNALTRENMTSILIQIKTDKRHFSGDLGYMDPFDVGLFSDGDAPLPGIRMVFVLGLDDPDVASPARKILVLPAGSLRTTFGARGCRQGRSRASESVMIYSHIQIRPCWKPPSRLLIVRFSGYPGSISYQTVILWKERRDVERETWRIVTASPCA